MRAEILLEDGRRVDDPEHREQGTEGPRRDGPGARAAFGEFMDFLVIRVRGVGGCGARGFGGALGFYVVERWW